MRDNLMARHFSLTANSLASCSGMALLMALLYLSSAQAALPRAVGRAGGTQSCPDAGRGNAGRR